jgi:trimethylamine--corrinoid protein Co-methyltransferase
MLQAVPMSLAGVNFIHLAFGMIGQLLTSSYEQALIDNEIFTAAFNLLKGVEISPETLAVDQIRAAGPGGQFLNHPFTLHNFRRFQWQPELTTRLPWEQWQQKEGGLDMRQRANRAARQLLDRHHPGMLSSQQETELERLAITLQEKAITTAGIL